MTKSYKATGSRGEAIAHVEAEGKSNARKKLAEKLAKYPLFNRYWVDNGSVVEETDTTAKRR